MTDDKEQMGFPKWEPKIYWFHLFKTMIENGDAREMGGNCFLCYCAIKARINFNTGRAFPSLETIANDCGLNRKTVLVHLKTLRKMGYVKSIRTKDRSNTYKIIEQIPIDYTDEKGEIKNTIAQFDYVPMGVARAVRDIKNVLVKGDLPNNSVVRIDNLTINLQINPSATKPQQIIVARSELKKEIDGFIEKWKQRGEEDE